MTTNMAPHKLREIVDGIVAYIDNNDITIEDLMKFITAPDFPTGGVTYGIGGVREAYRTGRGGGVVRAKAEIVTQASGEEQVAGSDIPDQVNKALVVEN